MDDVIPGPASNSLATWIFVSQLQYWVVLVVVMLALPLIIMGILRLQLLRRSHYYHFLMGICIANLVSLTTILVDLIGPFIYPGIKGDLACKVTPFLMNIAACFANWTFVVMFAQRFAILLFPLKRMLQTGCVGFLIDERKLLAVVLIFSVITQSWALVFMTERIYLNKDGNPMSTCEKDPTKIDASAATWMSVLEMFSTYLLPFICTLFVELGVLIWSKKFTTKFNDYAPTRTLHVIRTRRATSHIVLFKDHMNGSTNPKRSFIDQETGLKIQSKESIRLCNAKRDKAIKRCLIIATAQVFINLPYHTLQVFDEIYDLGQVNEQDWFTFYFYADALMYLIYLLQYPAVLVQIEFLISDATTTCKKSFQVLATQSIIVKSSVRRIVEDRN